MKKRKRIRKQFKIFVGVIVIIIIALIVGIKSYNKYLYHQTYEYKLLEKTYSNDEITIIKNKLSNEQIDEILQSDYIPSLTKFIEQKYYIFSNTEKYLTYLKSNPTEDIKTIVALVNVNRDSKFYENTTPTDVNEDILMLVNKYNYLDENYVPDNLINVPTTYAYDGNVLRSDVFDAFKNMYNAAKDSNISLILNSSYRSYKDQLETWETRKTAYGKDKADAYAARAGYSEHQTGLAIDVNEFKSTANNFDETEAFKWLTDNAYKYGFILRYPNGKENITGYSYESWHYRYVGTDAAKIIHDEDITFDEYYTFYIKKTTE